MRCQRNLLGRVQQLLGNMVSQFLWWWLPHKDLQWRNRHLYLWVKPFSYG
jgi:hypothetical protein